DQIFNLDNTGGVPATAISGAGLIAPFAFKDGAYPGTGGTCGATILPSTPCTIVVTYAPTTVAIHNDTIEIQYTDGATTQTSTRDVTGTGVNPALLSISDAPLYDYGTKAIGSETNKIFTITNNGGISASS